MGVSGREEGVPDIGVKEGISDVSAGEGGSPDLWGRGRAQLTPSTGWVALLECLLSADARSGQEPSSAGFYGD